MEFNRLLSEQVELMHRIGSNGIAPMLPSNGSHVSPCKAAFPWKYFNVFELLFASLSHYW